MIIQVDNNGAIQIPSEILDKLNICGNDYYFIVAR